jgi:uncharacterized protein with PIN domain
MPHAFVRFYAELNDFLPPPNRYVTSNIPFAGAVSVSDLIAASGVPLAEVDLVVRGGESVPMSAGVRDGDRIAVYPVFESFDISSLHHAGVRPLRSPRFVCDVHLGKLAGFLRMIGFDTLYRGDYHDTELIQISLDQRRALLSRDRRLLETPLLVRKFVVRSEVPLDQLKEVVRRFDLAEAARPFTRCLKCNAPLSPAGKEQVLQRLPEKVRSSYEEFVHCGGCDRVYWKGTHYERMNDVVRRVLEETRPPAVIG